MLKWKESAFFLSLTPLHMHCNDMKDLWVYRPGTKYFLLSLEENFHLKDFLNGIIPEQSFKMHLHIFSLQLHSESCSILLVFYFAPFHRPTKQYTKTYLSRAKYKNSQTTKMRRIKRYWSTSADTQCPDFSAMLALEDTGVHLVGSSTLKSVAGHKQRCRHSACKFSFQDLDFSSKPVQAGYRQAPKN